MKFQREKATVELFGEMFPLLKSHYEEIAHFKDIALEPDWSRYQQLEEIGCLRAFTARDENGLLIGYSVYFVNPNMHYKSSLQAVQDVLYVDKTRRGFGAKLILWCDRELAKEGVQAVYHHVKSEHNFGPMLERMGYRLVDLIYTRRLS